MELEEYSFKDLLSRIVDNRGKTCPTAETGTALIATNCISNEELYPVFEKVRWVDDETMKTWFRGHPEAGDILFVTKGSPGRCCLVPDPVNFCIAQDMLALRADDSKVTQRFLFALLRSPTVQNAIENLHVGTLIPHFKKGDFDQLFLNIPKSKEIQEKIGDIYFTLSDKIELNRKMNATLEAMAQALFKSWFVDFDPVIDNALAAGNPIPEELAPRAEIRRKVQQEQPERFNRHSDLFPSAFTYTNELGYIPEGWNLDSIYSLIEVIYGAPFKSSQFTSEGQGMPLIRIRDLKTGKPQNWTEEDHPKKTLITTGDIVVGMDAEFRATIWPGQDAYLNQRLFFAKPKRPIANGFYIREILRPQLEFEENTQVGTTVAHLGKKEIDKFNSLIPSDAVLEQYTQKTTPLLSRFINNLKATEQLTKLRDTLLPKLISGELRIPEAEQLSEEALA